MEQRLKMKIKNRYKFKVLNGDTGENSEIENMSFKKALKSLVNTNPKFNGAIYYTNKKGKYVCHSISKGKKLTDVFWKNPKLANWTVNDKL